MQAEQKGKGNHEIQTLWLDNRFLHVCVTCQFYCLTQQYLLSTLGITSNMKSTLLTQAIDRFNYEYLGWLNNIVQISKIML